MYERDAGGLSRDGLQHIADFAGRNVEDERVFSSLKSSAEQVRRRGARTQRLISFR